MTMLTIGRHQSAQCQRWPFRLYGNRPAVRTPPRLRPLHRCSLLTDSTTSVTVGKIWKIWKTCPGPPASCLTLHGAWSPHAPRRRLPSALGARCRRPTLAKRHCVLRRSERAQRRSSAAENPHRLQPQHCSHSAHRSATGGGARRRGVQVSATSQRTAPTASPKPRFGTAHATLRLRLDANRPAGNDRTIGCDQIHALCAWLAKTATRSRRVGIAHFVTATAHGTGRIVEIDRCAGGKCERRRRSAGAALGNNTCYGSAPSVCRRAYNLVVAHWKWLHLRWSTT